MPRGFVKSGAAFQRFTRIVISAPRRDRIASAVDCEPNAATKPGRVVRRRRKAGTVQHPRTSSRVVGHVVAGVRCNRL